MCREYQNSSKTDLKSWFVLYDLHMLSKHVNDKILPPAGRDCPPCKTDSSGLSPRHRLWGRGRQGTQACDGGSVSDTLGMECSRSIGQVRAQIQKSPASLGAAACCRPAPEAASSPADPVFISTLLPRGLHAALHRRPAVLPPSGVVVAGPLNF